MLTQMKVKGGGWSLYRVEWGRGGGSGYTTEKNLKKSPFITHRSGPLLLAVGALGEIRPGAESAILLCKKTAIAKPLCMCKISLCNYIRLLSSKLWAAICKKNWKVKCLRIYSCEKLQILLFSLPLLINCWHDLAFAEGFYMYSLFQPYNLRFYS